jgi:hypothetical protein
MGLECDHLVKFIFPELRRLCESRGVTSSEVDLRGGVTDDQMAEGKALPICLEEIKRCRQLGNLDALHTTSCSAFRRPSTPTPAGSHEYESTKLTQDSRRRQRDGSTFNSYECQ